MAEHKVFSKYLDSCYKNLKPEDTVETKADGSITFETEFLLSLYKRALFWNVKLFSSEKIRIAVERRELLKTDGYCSDYVKKCQYTAARDEAYMADIMDEMLTRVNRDHQFFQTSLISKMADP